MRLWRTEWAFAALARLARAEVSGRRAGRRMVVDIVGEGRWGIWLGGCWDWGFSSLWIYRDIDGVLRWYICLAEESSFVV